MLNSLAPSTLGVNLYQSQEKSDRTINPAHLSEWVKGSAVSEAIASLNIESLTANELNERIRPKTPIETGGWWVRGVSWRTGDPMGNQYGQAKPDKPYSWGAGKKSAKYMTASGAEPDAIFLAMPDKDYWINTYADKSTTRIWTEGAKKAGAGLTIGLPTIALTGVWNYGKEGQLATDVKIWAQPGTNHVICFDSDYQEKPECRAAIKRFVELLQAEGVASVKIASWNKEWKGMDDFIVANGEDGFKEVVKKASTIKQWEKQFAQSSSRSSKIKPPTSSQVTKEIAEKYREKLAWNIQVREWFLYGRKHEGVWQKSPKEVVEHTIKTELDSIMPDGFSYRFLTDVLNLLKGELKVEEWDSVKGLIPMQNGVLDNKTKKLSPHSPGYRLTYCLPFNYEPNATCEPIVNWLRETVGGKEDLVTFLLAYLNAVVNRRADLQRYLELIGPGGTGKSTYMKLASALVGKKNTHTTKHQLLEESRFETANLHGKSLVLITEADQYVGAVNALKAITGQDELHYEQKMQQAGEGFCFDGMVITAGNEPSRSTDYTSGLARRKIVVWFRNHILSHKRRDLDSEFKAYLPGLLNLVLSFSDEQVTRLIRDAEVVCPALREFQRDTLCETNPIADWLDNKLVRSPDSRHSPAFLYNEFKSYCEQSGQKPVSLKRFSNLLIDLCQVQLGWYDVKKGRDRVGRFVTGLAIRTDGDFSPFPVTEMLELALVTDEVTDVTDSVTAETTAVYGCDGCDAFFEETPTQNFSSEPVTEKTAVKTEKIGGQSVTRHASVTQSTPANSGELQKDDCVEYIGTHKSYKKYQGKKMVVTRVDSSSVSCRLIDADKELADKFQDWNLKRVDTRP